MDKRFDFSERIGKPMVAPHDRRKSRKKQAISQGIVHAGGVNHGRRRIPYVSRNRL
jgi:hypothetical protein